MLLGKRLRSSFRRSASLTDLDSDRSASLTELNLDRDEIMKPADQPQPSDPQQQQDNQQIDWLAKSNVATVTTMLGDMVSPQNTRSSASYAVQSLPFLKACGLCNKLLVADKDIYIYRGEFAYCSMECREEQINQDELKEQKEKRALKSMKTKTRTTTTTTTTTTTASSTKASGVALRL